MSSDWRDIKILLAVAESQSLRRAAPLVNLDAVTLGRRLNAMEESAGVKLFHRTPRGVVPTEAGLALLKEARQVRHYADRFFATLGRLGKRDHVTVRATNSMVSYVLAPL